MRITIGINVAAALLFFALPARADRRTLIRAYEYATQPKGNLELEIWNSLEIPKAQEGGSEGLADTLINQQIELEYGLTDHWDVALYHVFTSGGPRLSSGDRPGFGFDAWKVETRYRLAEKNEWPVDVMVYLEVERPADFEKSFEAEEKVILEKSLGNFALVSNLVAEQHVLHGNEGYLTELDLGARYEVSPALRLGAEVWMTRESQGGVTETKAFAGPSISLATQRFWIQLGAGFGLTGVGDTDGGAYVRSVLGFNL